MTDSQLRTLMESSPETGQRALYEEYCGYVYAITANCLRNCGSPEDIEECVADAFIAIFRVLRTDSGYEGDLKGIISTIARRTAIDAFRKLMLRSSRIVSLDDMPAELPGEESIEENAERTEMQRIVLDCVKQLGEPDSTIIIHHYFYGRTAGQTAGFLKMTESAVQKRLQRARKKLKGLLEKAGIKGV